MSTSSTLKKTKQASMRLQFYIGSWHGLSSLQQSVSQKCFRWLFLPVPHKPILAFIYEKILKPREALFCLVSRLKQQEANTKEIKLGLAWWFCQSSACSTSLSSIPSIYMRRNQSWDGMRIFPAPEKQRSLRLAGNQSNPVCSVRDRSY